SYSTAALPQIAIVDSSHKAGLFNGTAKEATLESSEHGAAPGRIRVSGFRPITDATGYFGRVSYRDLQSAAVTLTTAIAVNSIGNIDTNLTARYARGRIRIPAATTWTFATGIEPDAILESLY